MALSCLEIRASICAIRALIIAWVSFDTVIVPVMTWSTNSPIRSLARARCSSSRAMRPWEMIWSRRLASSWAGAADAARLCSAAPLMSGLLSLGLAPAGLAAELLQRLGVVDHVLEQLLQLVVAVHLVDQVGQPVPRLQQLAQGLDLLDDLLRLEVVHVAELQLDVDLRAVPLEGVVRLERQPGLHPRQHLVEVVAVDLHELAVL